MTETTRRIIELQKQKGINDHQLEMGASLAVSSMQSWKNGKKQKSGKVTETTPSSEAIIKLARYFNVSADYLLCLTDEPTPLKEQPTAVAERPTTALSTELAELSNDKDFVDSAKLYNAMENEYKKQICAYILGVAVTLGLNTQRILGR